MPSDSSLAEPRAKLESLSKIYQHHEALHGLEHWVRLAPSDKLAQEFDALYRELVATQKTAAKAKARLRCLTTLNNSKSA